MQLSRITRRLKRLPILWWCAVACLAVISVMTLSNSVARAEAAAQRYDQPTKVAVAKQFVTTGEVVESDDVRFEERPRAFVPQSPTVDNPIGRIVTSDVVSGEVFVEANIGLEGLGPIAALLGANERAIAIPTDDVALQLSVDDRVDVIASFRTPEGEDSALVISRGARIVAVEVEAVSIAVPETEAPPVALATSRGKVALVLALPG